MKPRQRWLAIYVLLVTVLTVSQSATAQIFGGRFSWGRNPYWGGPVHRGWYGASYNSFPTDPPLAPTWLHGPVRRAPTHEEYKQYMNSHFPKYYGGFHANYFQDIGIPPGDVGLRGNGIFPSPW